mgnify:CR=1 FL=1
MFFLLFSKVMAIPPTPNFIGMSGQNQAIDSYSSLTWTSSPVMIDVLTVPSDKIFIIRTFIAINHGTCLYEGSTKIFCYSRTHSEPGISNTPLIVGNGHLKVDSGSTLRVDHGYYYIDGYYAEPNNWPYETFYGYFSTPGQSDSLFSVPSDKNFIVTSFSTNYEQGAAYITLYGSGVKLIDGVIVSPSNEIRTALQKGNARYKIESNTTLSVVWDTTSAYTSGASYYIEGYYSEP